MILLALSSSGPFPSVALCEDGAILDYLEGESGHTHSETLMPLLERLLLNNNIKLDDIDLFSADIGPGSFTGVRIGVCAANAMAFVRNKKLIGVSALEALCFGTNERICAMLDARNDSVYTAVYENGMCVSEPQALTVGQCLSKLESCSLFAGDGALAYREQIEKYIPGARVRTAPLRADNVAMIAYKRYCGGESFEEILPLYLRPSQAERLFEERNSGNKLS